MIQAEENVHVQRCKTFAFKYILCKYIIDGHLSKDLLGQAGEHIEDITRVVISYEIYQTGLWRV